jgi:hypothetical protein
LSVARFGIEFDDARGGSLISPVHHRAQRFAFVAGIELTALDTEVHIAAHTEDLSLFGCFVETSTPFEEETRVRLRILHKGVTFTAQGKVAYSRHNAGMGVAFTSIEPSGVSILDAWLTELRNL